jgi:hypothetical protein
MEAEPIPYSHHFRTLCNTQGLAVMQLGPKIWLGEYSAVIKFPVCCASHPQHQQPLIQGVCFQNSKVNSQKTSLISATMGVRALWCKG